MIRETFNTGAVHDVLNHPSILPAISEGGARLDVTELLLSGRGKACLVIDEGIFHDGDTVVGCFLFVQAGPGAWEIHTNLLPEIRGQAGVEHTQDAIEWAFANLDATVLYTQSGTEAVSKYAEFHGFRRMGVAPQRHFPSPCTLLRLTIHDWIDSQLAGARFLAAGREFHAFAEKERQAAGAETHDDDEMHDRYAGFVVRMLRHCSLEGAVKAVRIYNEWASQANYHPIHLIALARGEIVVDIGDMALALSTDGGFWRLK